MKRVLFFAMLMLGVPALAQADEVHLIKEPYRVIFARGVVTTPTTGMNYYIRISAGQQEMTNPISLVTDDFDGDGENENVGRTVFDTGVKVGFNARMRLLESDGATTTTLAERDIRVFDSLTFFKQLNNRQMQQAIRASAQDLGYGAQQDVAVEVVRHAGWLAWRRNLNRTIEQGNELEQALGTP